MRQSEFSALVAELAAAHDVAGLAAAVVLPEGVLTATAGVTSSADPLPVDEDTLFFMGSTTKTLTATALMVMVDKGALRLGDLVRDVLPELRLADAATHETVTVEMLLNHTGGWRGDGLVDSGWGDDALALAASKALPFEAQVTPAGSVVSYNNSALLVAGRLLEVVSGQEYTAAVRQLVLGPLGMNSTFFLPWEATGRRLAVGHLVQDGVPSPLPGWPLTRASGPSGGAVSSLCDQVRWARYCLDGTTDGAAPLRDETRRQMQAVSAPARSTISGVGLTWLLQERGDVRLVTHGGNVSNLHLGTFVMAPDLGVAIVVGSNSRGGHEVGKALVDHALHEHLGVPVPPALPRQPAANDLVGSYDAGAWQEQITSKDETLFIQKLLPDAVSPEVRALFAAAPVEIVPVGVDQLALASRPWEAAGDVGRDARGHIAWLRWGMRVMPRVTA